MLLCSLTPPPFLEHFLVPPGGVGILARGDFGLRKLVHPFLERWQRKVGL